MGKSMIENNGRWRAVFAAITSAAVDNGGCKTAKTSETYCG